MSGSKTQEERLKAEIAKKHNIREFEEYETDWNTLDKVDPEEIIWFWDSFIPARTSTIFAGNGGIGKSLILLWLISHVTNGKLFLCCGKSIQIPCGSVILLSAEGRIETDVIPKLIAEDADRTKIYATTSKIGKLSKKRRLLRLDAELSELEIKVKALYESSSPVKLIVIDPITYFIGDIKDHVPREVADFIHQLNDLADRYNLTIIFNKHRRKQSGGQTFASLADEVGGTAAWVNSPRQAIGFIKHPKTPNSFLMGSIKSNSTPESQFSYPYTIEPTTIDFDNKDLKTIQIVWAEKMERINLNDASSKDLYEKNKFQQCSDLIFKYLKENGITTRSTLIDLCNKYGINERLRQRAINTMKKAQEINEVKKGVHPQYELNDNFDSFGK